MSEDYFATHDVLVPGSMTDAVMAAVSRNGWTGETQVGHKARARRTPTMQQSGRELARTSNGWFVSPMEVKQGG